MNAFFLFDDGTVKTDRQQALQREAERWVGTPFVAHSMIRGAGVDCVHLAAALYVSTGAIEDFRPPGYSLDGGMHSETSTVINWLDKHPRFQQVNDAARAPGDLLCFKFSRSEHHVGVLIIGDNFLHAPIRRKVVYGTLRDPVYLRTLSAVYRPVFPSAIDHAQFPPPK